MEKAEDLIELLHLCRNAGLSVLTVSAAMHMAMDQCDDPIAIGKYGTFTTDELRKLRDDLTNNPTERTIYKRNPS